MDFENHPAPEVPCRAAADSELPRNAKALLALALANGWAAHATYARGTMPGVIRVVDSIAVRMRRGDERLAALWYDGKFDTALAPLQPYNFKEIKAVVMSQPAQVAA